MYSVMSVANVYPTRTSDKSYQAVQHGFVKTLLHVSILVITIIVMSIHYSQITYTTQKTTSVDKTKEEYIPFSAYNTLWQDYKYENAISCDCSNTQISWEGITDQAIINHDEVCNAVLIAYNSCYNDGECRFGFVGNTLFYYFYELCENAQMLYPMGKPPYELPSAKLFRIDELYLMALYIARDWQDSIAIPFKTTFYMTYQWLNNDTKFFQEWALTTTFEELENASYWAEVWGLQNSSHGIADAFARVAYDELGYFTVFDAIDEAFIDYIEIHYRYSNDTGKVWVNGGYYERCAPYHCVVFITEKKSFVEIVVVIFALLGGLHAALFVVLNILHALYKKLFGVSFSSDEEAKEETETEMYKTIATSDPNELDSKHRQVASDSKH